MDDATRLDAADMMLVTKNKVPNLPFGRPNFLLKKYVTHDLFIQGYQLSCGQNVQRGDIRRDQA